MSYQKRILALSLILGILSVGLSAQTNAGPADASALKAIVAEVEGKVEFQPTKDSPWKPLKVGQEIFRDTMVSTGFKSTATIKLGPDTILVKPVTRLTLKELIPTQGGTSTKLFLTVGRVKAEVNPEKKKNIEFSIKSATATASVRGTGFETDGTNLVVTHGLVSLANNYGQYRYVGAGEYSKVDNDSTITIPVAVNPENGLERLDELTDQAAMENNAIGNTMGGSPPTPVTPTGTVTLIME